MKWGGDREMELLEVLGVLARKDFRKAIEIAQSLPEPGRTIALEMIVNVGIKWGYFKEAEEAAKLLAEPEKTLLLGVISSYKKFSS